MKSLFVGVIFIIGCVLLVDSYVNIDINRLVGYVFLFDCYCKIKLELW